MTLDTITEITNPQGNVRNITTYYKGIVVNNPPTLVGSRISVTQDITYIFSTNDITNFFSDIEGSSALSIKIESTPLKGKLKFNGLDVHLGQIIFLTDISQLNYEPPTGAFGFYYSSFKLRVNDNGIAPNPFSEISKIVIDIAAIQPPSVLDNCITVIEGQDYNFQLVDFSNGYQDDNTIEPEFISFVQLPNEGNIVAGTSIQTNPLTVDKLVLVASMKYRPPIQIYEDEFTFQVGDDQGLFSTQQKMCVKILSKPVLQLVWLQKFCFGDARNIYQDIIQAYSNGDGSALKSIEITFMHAGYILSLNNVVVVLNQVISASDLQNLVLEVSDVNSASQTINFSYIATSINNIQSDQQDFLATVGEVADFDCADFDEQDFFTFNQ